MTTDQSALAECSIEDFVKSFRKNGYSVAHNILPPDTVAALRREFEATYPHYWHKDFFSTNSEHLKVGSKRYMCHVDLTGGFGSSDVIANPHMLPKIRTLLGADAIIESYGVIVSLPGSKAQHRHRDGQLFDGAVGRLIPPHALTLVIPLIEMNAETGSTAFWPGSHLPNPDPGDDVPSETPVIPVGSCALWDFRTLHCGMPNLSSAPRPILYLTYAKSWFRDSKNFSSKDQRRLSINGDFLANLTDEHRPLFSHLLLPDSSLIGSSS